jgi:hypothetical protein
MSKADGVGLDTLFILLFLAIEYSRAGEFLSIEAGFMAITLLMVFILPYFLPTDEGQGASLGKWLALRGLVILAGLSLGAALPESMRSVPMTLLIIAGIFSCFVRFYGLMKLRLAD